MRDPAYQWRDKRTLRRALRWAQRKLQIRDWTIELIFDDAVLAEADLRGVAKYAGGSTLWTWRMHGLVGIRRDLCEKEGVDPVAVLFHECAHVGCDRSSLTDRKRVYKEATERAMARIERLLYQLYLAEGNE